MGDEEGMWGKPSKFFISDKPIDLTKLSDMELMGAMRGGGKSRIQMELIEQSVDWKELDCSVEDWQFHTVTETQIVDVFKYELGV